MNIAILDSIYELGLRAMLILLHQAPRYMSLERIIYYDKRSVKILSRTRMSLDSLEMPQMVDMVYFR